ncbi:DUF881 domain-containing protein [Calidifontibacillus erzurumensis]|uniref:DUF881 domain-containing protein n=1 Tax=Calidifontibacillus erzurumensis TaxID=2741433 RepID=A0A8J8KAG5_9BACI|nr:DUF881 domain-containing protein [Calidifontibacillus erzurumensis]NSL50784.1 DUF881 domain-containing protein [Calidifontibacillus erzurumensis]
MRVNGKYAILSLVALVLGFLISFSYQLTNKQSGTIVEGKQWQREYELREKLIRLEETTKRLQQELVEKQQSIREIEAELANQEKSFKTLLEDVEKLRMFAGEVKVKGPGVEVTLSDASYVKAVDNANNYIVHEGHVHKVINELLTAGAKAIAINGQRLVQNSYIACIGPVISVDGHEHSAPFIISAIGDPEVLYSALTILHGVRDQLVMENIEVKIEKKNELIFEPYFGVTED